MTDPFEFPKECFGCGEKILNFKGVGLAMGMPGVTPSGGIYYCKKCRPPAGAKEMIEQIQNFIHPPKEKGNEKVS